MELWLKTYLSLFFNFKNFGILNWLAIPLFIYFIATIKKRKRWEIAIVFVLFLSFLLFSVRIKGQGNPRYIFTLYPFTLAVIFLMGWELIKSKSRQFQTIVLVICGIAVLFNYYHFRNVYKPYWSYKVIVKNDRFPSGIFTFINNIDNSSSDSIFLICSSRSLFYYYGNKKGIDYRDPKFQEFYRKKKSKDRLDFVKNQLKIKYILIQRDIFPRDPLRDLITKRCDLLYHDRYELSLYQIREKDLYVEKELSKEKFECLFINNSILKNGSFENWTNGPHKNPDFFEGGGNIPEGSATREEKEVKVGKYSAKITGDNFNFLQNISDFKEYRGKKITCFAWIKTDVRNKYRIQIYDGIDFSSFFRHPGNGKWELLQVNHTVNPEAKFLTVRVIQAAETGRIDDVVYVDGVLLLEGFLNINDLYSKNIKERE